MFSYNINTMETAIDTSKNAFSEKNEILLKDNPGRFVLFPIKYDKIWKAYKDQMACFWRSEEIDLSKDRADWDKLNENERHFIKNILAFFAGSDGIVLENLGVRFLKEVQIPEARCFYGFQLMMENVHSETYSLLIDTYITDKKEKDHLFNQYNFKRVCLIGNCVSWRQKKNIASNLALVKNYYLPRDFPCFMMSLIIALNL